MTLLEEPLVTFADVILPLSVRGYYTYRVPMDMEGEISVGSRVVVQFGQQRVYTALVRRIHHNIPASGLTKYVLSVLDEKPLVSEWWLEMVDWISEYYMSSPGEVLSVALPSVLKMASETKISICPGLTEIPSGLSAHEDQILELLMQSSAISLKDLSKAIGLNRIVPVARTLMDKGLVVLEEQMEEKLKPRFEKYISLSDTFCTETALRELFEHLEKRSPRQVDILTAYITLSGWPNEPLKEVTRKQLLEASGTTSTVLEAMIRKSIFDSSSSEVSRFSEEAALNSAQTISLSLEQERSYNEIKGLLDVNKPILFHGITGSGKTEIFIKLIDEVISNGGQVLYLLPEIALTTQIVGRLKHFFGDKVGVYHSRFNEQERGEVWKRVGFVDYAHSYQVILGARSSLFLPFSNLKLIIVDEEHDGSYKQFDPAPRYQARDTAVVLGRKVGAQVILGSATPSVESYYNATSGRFSLVRLMQRYGDGVLPTIEIVDVRLQRKAKTFHGGISAPLLAALRGALEGKRQSIIFQNRRGFSQHLECENCGWVPTCRNCDVSLTYHKALNLLRCHYCGYSTTLPKHCEECGDTKIRLAGAGTERIEEDLGLLLPTAKIARMDIDSTRSKYSFQKILESFSSGDVDVLVGTQMVTKGLDFSGVQVVGVVNADTMLNFPDFRAYEKSFQQLSQVAGRAGRKDSTGKVFIQTSQGGNPILSYVMLNDYNTFFNNIIEERKQYNYPPYCRMVYLYLRHADSEVVTKASNLLADRLRPRLGKNLLGPVFPMVARVKNLYIRQLIFKLEKNNALGAQKRFILENALAIVKEPGLGRVLVSFDVDPG